MCRAVKRILVTGMSGTGKSTVLGELARKGYRVVDTDEEDWSEEVPLADGSGFERLWRKDLMDALLAPRTTDPFGKDPAERDRILEDLAAVEPWLRSTATLEISTDRPLSDVVRAVEGIAGP